VGNISCAHLAYNRTERINGYSTSEIDETHQIRTVYISFSCLCLLIYHPPSNRPICTPQVRRISFSHSPTTHCRFFCYLPRIFFHLAIGVLSCAHSSVFVKFCLTLPTFVSWTVPIAIKKCMYYYCRLFIVWNTTIVIFGNPDRAELNTGFKFCSLHGRRRQI